MGRDDQEKGIFSKIDFQSSGGLNEKSPQRVALLSDWFPLVDCFRKIRRGGLVGRGLRSEVSKPYTKSRLIFSASCLQTNSQLLLQSHACLAATMLLP